LYTIDDLKIFIHSIKHLAAAAVLIGCPNVKAASPGWCSDPFPKALGLPHCIRLVNSIIGAVPLLSKSCEKTDIFFEVSFVPSLPWQDDHFGMQKWGTIVLLLGAAARAGRMSGRRRLPSRPARKR
jgi:hypothetical protein